MIGTIGAGIGIGVVVNGAVQGIARNPDASGTVQTNMILGIAFAEAVAIYCLVIALDIFRWLSANSSICEPDAESLEQG